MKEALEHEKEDLANKTKAMVEDYERQISNLKSNSNDSLSELNKQHQRAIDDLKAEYEKKIADLKNDMNH